MSTAPFTACLKLPMLQNCLTGARLRSNAACAAMLPAHLHTCLAAAAGGQEGHAEGRRLWLAGLRRHPRVQCAGAAVHAPSVLWQNSCLASACAPVLQAQGVELQWRLLPE